MDAHYQYDGDGRRVLTVVGGARTVYIADYFEAELGDGSSPTSLPALQNYPASLPPSQPARVFLPGVMKPQAAAQTTSGNHGTALFRTHPVDPPEGVTWRSYYSAGGARVAEREITHPVGGPISQQVFYLIADHQGSTTLVTDENGENEQRSFYTTWGQTRAGSETLPTRRLYTGQLEAEAGLLFYNSRYYDPLLSRWIQPDTYVPESQGVQAWDRYAYVNNNPVNATDPSGHIACWDEHANDPGCKNYTPTGNGLTPESQPSDTLDYNLWDWVPVVSNGRGVVRGIQTANQAAHQPDFMEEQKTYQTWVNNCYGVCHGASPEPGSPNGGPKPDVPLVDTYSQGAGEAVGNAVSLLIDATYAKATTNIFASGGKSWHVGWQTNDEWSIIHVGNAPNPKWGGIHLAIGSVGPRQAFFHIYFYPNPHIFINWPK